jgi:hypothetical protein
LYATDWPSVTKKIYENEDLEQSLIRLGIWWWSK